MGRFEDKSNKINSSLLHWCVCVCVIVLYMIRCLDSGIMVGLTSFALPGESQHPTVVSVSEQVGQAELAPVAL